MNPAFNPGADMEFRLARIADQAMADVVRAAPNFGVSPSADSPPSDQAVGQDGWSGLEAIL